MYSKVKNFVLTHYISIVRIFAATIGCVGLVWGAVEAAAFWRDSTLERMATQIIAGHEFKNETLSRQLPAIEKIASSGLCRPAAVRSAAIIRLRLFERTSFASAQERSSEQVELIQAIRNSLSCAPADGFLWLAMYFIGVNEKGLDSESINALRQSYRVAPHEGWIALKRSRVAFAGFNQLPPDLGEAAINEFVDMLHDGHFYGFAGDILIGPAWPERDFILLHLSRLSDANRIGFMEELRRRGYVRVPGIGLAPVDSHRFAPQIRVPQ
jgi:hypothetical protein